MRFYIAEGAHIGNLRTDLSHMKWHVRDEMRNQYLNPAKLSRYRRTLTVTQRLLYSENQIIVRSFSSETSFGSLESRVLNTDFTWFEGYDVTGTACLVRTSKDGYGEDILDIVTIDYEQIKARRSRNGENMYTVILRGLFTCD